MYRAPEHGHVKRRFVERRPKRVLARFPQEIQDFADQFVRLQRLRHLADYDPLERFSRYTVSQYIDETKVAITDFERVHRDDRRAFAVFVLFDLRSD